MYSILHQTIGDAHSIGKGLPINLPSFLEQDICAILVCNILDSLLTLGLLWVCLLSSALCL